MKTQIQKKLKSAPRFGLLALAALVSTCGWTQAAVTVTFGESTPVDDIITSYDVTSSDGFQWRYQTGDERQVSQSFVVPLGLDYSVESISMRFGDNYAINGNFPEPSAFSISFYEVAQPGDSPVAGLPLGTQVGTMQPTTAQAIPGSFFTFQLDTPLLVEAGKSYAYTLSFDEATSYNLLHIGVADAANPAGTRIWASDNGAPWELVSATYVYYIQGTAVPEPGVAVLLIGAGLGLYGIRRIRRSSGTGLVAK